SQKLATPYQIGLLTLIQEYHIIKKRGEEFGKIAIEKGFATDLDVKKAIDFQKKEFKRARIKKLIGDILVESRVITTKQKNNILKEQLQLEQEANNIISSEQKKRPADSTRVQVGDILISEDDSELTDYEKKFLQIKVLDREFAARVTEKGLASEQQVIFAQSVQEEEFEKKNTLKILGDIMVTLSFITEEQKNIVLEEQNRFRDNIGFGEKESAIEVILSPDNKTAKVRIDKKFLPETAVDQLKTALKALGITNGIYPDALLQCQLSQGNIEFYAAKSDAFPEQIPPRNLDFHLGTNLTKQGEKRKGDLLAEHNPSQEALIKKDLLGNQVRQEYAKKLDQLCGSGTRLSQDGTSILASKTGIPSMSIDGKLFIHPIIHVLEDADLRYGPLEAYANLSISGVLTGAYPITAGSIKAREIRGARIDSIGTIRTDVGITDTIIRSQGDIHARYLHNCRIETFGNIYIKNEIYDSTITTSGKIDSPGCRIISSSLSAKKGIVLAGAGSEKTRPCSISAGNENHILGIGKFICKEIALISAKLDALIEKKDEQECRSQKAFQKMVELKIFHDRAKGKRQFLAKEFKTHKEMLNKEKLKNIVKLIANFETRIEKSIASLKELSKIKQLYDQKKIKLENKINSLTPKVNAQIVALEETMFVFFEWTRYQENISRIEIHGKAFPGTIFSGIYSSTQIESSLENFSIFEITDSETNHRMAVLKPE
ncbi:MAG: FapA family protein, partial [Proteobacteria bacterium]|nr:FapA family protein [Pseudomonadota bacterium]